MYRFTAVKFNSGMTRHKACTLCKQTGTQTHTKWVSGRGELEGGVVQTERKQMTGRVEWDRLLATNRGLILAH